MNRRRFAGLTGAGVAGLIAERHVEAAQAAQPNPRRTARTKALLNAGKGPDGRSR